ncbi:hypothetical protein L1887_55210 [Cichorium endivia]|nr:hypothetical protein L1887_55210 [Cichorium endivia]
MSLDKTTAWMRQALSEASDDSGLPRSQVMVTAFNRGMLQLIFDVPGTLPVLSQVATPLGSPVVIVAQQHLCHALPRDVQFDAYRMMTFHNDVSDLTIVYMLLLLFRQLCGTPLDDGAPLPGLRGQPGAAPAQEHQGRDLVSAQRRQPPTCGGRGRVSRSSAAPAALPARPSALATRDAECAAPDRRARRSGADGGADGDVGPECGADGGAVGQDAAAAQLVDGDEPAQRIGAAQDLPEPAARCGAGHADGQGAQQPADRRGSACGSQQGWRA